MSWSHPNTPVVYTLSTGHGALRMTPYACVRSRPRVPCRAPRPMITRSAPCCNASSRTTSGTAPAPTQTGTLISAGFLQVLNSAPRVVAQRLFKLLVQLPLRPSVHAGYGVH